MERFRNVNLGEARRPTPDVAPWNPRRPSGTQGRSVDVGKAPVPEKTANGSRIGKKRGKVDAESPLSSTARILGNMAEIPDARSE
jgi:hypothetical protein